MASAYTSVNNVLQIEPFIGSASHITSAHILAAIERAESEVNGILAQNYTVPLSGTVPLVKGVVEEITVYKLLAQRMFTAERLQESPWPRVFKEAYTRLNAIGSGKVTLVNSAGTVIEQITSQAEAKTNTMGWKPTHTMQPFEEQARDPNKMRSIRDERQS